MSIPPDRRQEIGEAVKAGRSYRDVAAEFGVSIASVSNVVRELELNDHVNVQRVKRAAEASAEYNLERRMGLSNRFFEKIGSLLETVETANAMKDLAMAHAIETDKRRLEEGAVTERHEYNDRRAAIEQGRERLKILGRRTGS